MPRTHQLKVTSKGGNSAKFTGFVAEDLKHLESFLKNSGAEAQIKKIKISTKGWNWGDMTLKHSNIHFKDDEENATFELPLAALSQSVIQGKNELGLVFHSDDTVDAEEQCLVEMR